MLEHRHGEQAPRRVVVIGAQGFVGRAVLRRCQAAGMTVLGVGRAEVDLLAARAADKLAALLRPGDAVVTAAAIAPCKNADMLVDNMVLARTLVRALAAVDVSHVVNISSDAVYADSDQPLTEDSPRAPGSLHGVMHLARELMFADGLRVPIATLRPTLLYGPDDPHNGYGPNRFLRLAQKGEPIALFGQGEERRDHVFIEDLAELTASVLLRESQGALNVASGEVRSFHSIAEDAIRLAASGSRIESLPRSGPMPHNGYRPFDISACRRAFPAFRYTDFDAGLARSLRKAST